MEGHVSGSVSKKRLYTVGLREEGARRCGRSRTHVHRWKDLSLIVHVEKNVCVEKEQSGEELGVNVQIRSGWRMRGESHWAPRERMPV